MQYRGEHAASETWKWIGVIVENIIGHAVLCKANMYYSESGRSKSFVAFDLNI